MMNTQFFSSPRIIRGGYFSGVGLVEHADPELQNLLELRSQEWQPSGATVY